MDRRAFVSGTLSTLAACSCGFATRALAGPVSVGCRAAGIGDSIPWTNVGESTGNAEWDKRVKSWLDPLCSKFGVRPTLVFYDDGSYLNAQATPHSYFTQGPDGTVAFGRNFAKKYFEVSRDCAYKISNEERRKQIEGDRKRKPWELMSQSEFAAWWCDQPDSFFANLQPLLITAHEFGHILQFKMGMGVDGPWQMEPHADYMAGWYVGNVARKEGAMNSRGNLSDQTLMAFAETMFSLGDTAFNDKAHHGEPAFRAAMVRAGYDVATLDAKAAFEKGRAIVGLPAPN
jgi:hypothetical protein